MQARSVQAGNSICLVEHVALLIQHAFMRKQRASRAHRHYSGTVTVLLHSGGPPVVALNCHRHGLQLQDEPFHPPPMWLLLLVSVTLA